MTTITNEQIADWKRGEAELGDLVGFDDAFVQNLRGRAQWFIDGGHTDRALIMLDMLAELDRRDAAPALTGIELLLDDGRSDAAEDRIQLLLARMPDNPDVRAAQAELLVSAARLSEAAPILEALIAADPEARTPAGMRAHRLVGVALANS